MEVSLQLAHYKKPRTLDEISSAGIKTASDYAEFMGILMMKVVSGEIEPKVANAACQAGSQLLKVVEMRQRHGKETPPEKTDDDEPLVAISGQPRAGQVKCNQCSEFMSHGKVLEHKRLKHPVTENPRGTEERSMVGSGLAQ